MQKEGKSKIELRRGVHIISAYPLKIPDDVLIRKTYTDKTQNIWWVYDGKNHNINGLGLLEEKDASWNFTFDFITIQWNYQNEIKVLPTPL